MKIHSTKIRTFSLITLWMFTLLSVGAAYFAAKVPTNYALEQFLPKTHTLLTADNENRKLFKLSDTAPHIVLLSFKPSTKEKWYNPKRLHQLQTLAEEFSELKGVKSVISLGNIPTAFENKKELLVATLSDLQKRGYDVSSLSADPLFAPNLMSKDGHHAALFVIPHNLEQSGHQALMLKLRRIAQRHAPEAQVQVGGPAAIRTQFVDLLSREILVFILLSLICAIVVIKIMFHGYSVVPQMLFILTVANVLSIGMMGFFHFSFNVLSSTLPIIVTITSLGIASHSLVRMAETAHLSWLERMTSLVGLMRELIVPHMLTALTTALGFATLMSSDVPLIGNYGLVVAASVLISAVSTLALVPALYVWVQWPKPRGFLSDAKRFSHFLTANAKWLTPSIGILVLFALTVGQRLSWTARLFDDLPQNHAARRSTDLIAKKLGGVASVDFMVGSNKKSDTWKDPEMMRRLHATTDQWRKTKDVGSVLSLADFMTVGKSKTIPKKREALAEMQFLYAMSGESPLKQFLSSDEKFTRIAVRLPDLPANRNQQVIAQMRSDLQKQFPGFTVSASGLAAIVPTINTDLSKHLMWGFFESLFWIVLLLTLAFRSLRWALVAVLPNLVPPALLLGLLALFQIPIKPGIAIIFSISLGLAFCNTVYVLERLKHLLKSGARTASLPIYLLMKKETMPCLVSSLSLFAGFSIFLFSVFPVNKLFGVFMLVSIGAGLLGDLVWLPAMLKRYPWLLLDKGNLMIGFNWPRPLQAHKLIQYALLIALGLVAFRSSYAAGGTSTAGETRVVGRSKTAGAKAADTKSGRGPASAEDVQSILKSVEKRSAPPNEAVDLQMVIQDSDGSKKIRELQILRKNDKGARALVRLEKPADLKGLALLTLSKDGTEDQYLYLPSDKKSRRIVGSNKKGKFLDSDIAFEDLALSTYKDFHNKIIKDSAKSVEIESVAKAGSDSSYSRVITSIARPEYRVEKVQYFDKSGKLLKTAEFKKYEKLGDQFWRARQVLVTNVQEKRRTQLTVKKISLKEIDDDDISLSALED